MENTFYQIFDKDMFVGIMAVIGLIIVAFFTIKRISSAKTKSNDIEELLQFYLEWNQSIQTKQAALDFYYSMSETCRQIWNVEFKVQMTRQEFDSMSLDNIKLLNKQALNDIIDQIK